VARVYWCEEGKHEFVVPDDWELLQWCPLHPNCLGILVEKIPEEEEEKAKELIETA